MSLPIYLTVETALQALIGYITQELSIVVIQAHQPIAEADRPAMPYVTVYRRTGRDLSTMHHRVGDALSAPEGDESELTHEVELTRMREINVEVSFYGDSGPALAELLPTTVGRDTARTYLQEHGIQIRPMADVIDTREMRDTANEASAMVEIGVLYAVRDVYSGAIIETVKSDVTGTSTDYDVTD